MDFFIAHIMKNLLVNTHYNPMHTHFGDDADIWLPNSCYQTQRLIDTAG